MTGQLQLGLTAGVPEALYHRGIVDGEESLSHSGMKTLLGKTPAHFRYEIDHPEDRVQKKSFDLGSVAHDYVLGADAGIAEIRRGGDDQHPYGTGEPYDDFRTKDAQQKRDLAYSQDLTPILAKDVARVEAMLAALRRHPKAAELLEPGSGLPEVSGFARDPESGVLLRARYDWFRHDHTVADFKTTAKLADPGVFARTAYDFAYYLQDPTYRHVAALCDVEIAAFDFVIQETTPPYEVSVVHLGEASIELGRRRMREAINVYAACAAFGVWPGYSQTESVEVDLPYWALRDLELINQAAAADEDTTEADNAGIFSFLDSINN